MNRHERRREAALARRRYDALAHDERAINIDRLFFAAHPDRLHRVRIALPTEHELVALLPGFVVHPDDDLFVSVARQGALYERIFFTASPDLETDLSEVEAREVREFVINGKHVDLDDEPEAAR